MKNIIFLLIFSTTLLAQSTHQIDDDQTTYISFDGRAWPGGEDDQGNAYIQLPDGTMFVLGQRMPETYGLNRHTLFRVHDGKGMYRNVYYDVVDESLVPVDIEGGMYINIDGMFYPGGRMGENWYLESSPSVYVLGTPTGVYFRGHQLFRHDKTTVFYINTDHLPKRINLSDELKYQKP